MNVLPARSGFVAVLLVLPGAGTPGCSPQYQLLESIDRGGTASTGGGASTAESGGEPHVGGAASGSGGTPSGSGGTGNGGETNGADTGGAGVGGGAGFGGSANGGSASGGSAQAGSAAGGGGANCTTHGNCSEGNLCSSYQCTPCADTPDRCTTACTHGFQLVELTRNGCHVCECVPPSECTTSSDCSNGESCYPGLHCADDCNDPSCCFGNQCSRAGCGLAPTFCLEFGCQDGSLCLAACDATSCECDGASFHCQSTTGGAAVASCPQACAPP